MGAPPQPPLLNVSGLEIEFPVAGREPVRPVRGVELTIGAGQRVGLVGESGSGKSLTGLAIMRLIRSPGRIAAGRIELDGQDLLALSEDEIASVRGGRIAMIYQNPMSALNPVHTIGRQLIEALRTHEPVGKAVARRRACELLTEVGLADAVARLDDYPHQFSGGMRQRVVIAMAMIAEPALVIADECTTALDVTTQARIVELLGRMVDEREAAVLFVTHDLELAAEFCTEVRVMYAGRIVESAPMAPFHAAPLHPYASLLLRSICRLDTPLDRPIAAIEGQPPQPGAFPEGCAFAPRCPYVLPICREVDPRFEPVAGAARRTVACHRAEERASEAAA